MAPPPDAHSADAHAIALALGGGAALGWAHIGVLAVLARAGIRIGAVAGTSIGALAAACLAANKLDVLETLARGATRLRTFAYLDPSLARGAWLGGRRIRRELEAHFAGRTLEELAIPTALVAADLDSGEEVRLTRGPLIPAIEASIAIPGLFRPVVIGARRLIDGGMVANLPITAARALAPDLPVVAVDVMGDYAAGGPPPASPGALAVTRSAFLMMIAAQTRAAITLDPPEVLIRPAIGHLSTGSFHQAEKLICDGQAAAEAALPAIRAALLPKN